MLVAAGWEVFLDADGSDEHEILEAFSVIELLLFSYMIKKALHLD